jgi:hypothetical protein
LVGDLLECGNDGRTAVTEQGSIDPDGLLLGAGEVRDALGPGVFVEVGEANTPVQHLGTVLGAAAIASSYRSYSGRAAGDDLSIPIKIGLMSLVFADTAIAQRTFGQVANASHLRTKLGLIDVSVETVTASSGLVSYWGYLFLGRVLTIATLDTLDPTRISMTEFRSLVTRLADHIEEALPD